MMAAVSQPLMAEKIVAPSDRALPSDARSKVQIALLLDTSNSMDGLIDQARSQLWKVVNTFIDAERDGVAPFVEVALYEYGNNSQPVGNNYIRLVQPLTRDLDSVSTLMFQLKTNGGDEYCGAAIQRALADLSWDSNPKTYKAVFIAGNEPFTQGPVDAQQACRDSVAKSVIVNTIHCGSREQGISGSWHDGAAISGGKFMTINQDQKVSHIEAPQDKKIAELGAKLNDTYIGYGERRREAVKLQVANDAVALEDRAAGADVQRAITKSSVNYSNSSWDLVDAMRDKKVDLGKLKKEELPEKLRALDKDELKKCIEAAAKNRVAIQSEIAALNEKRKDYVETELAKQAADGEKTLDQVMVETTRAQAAALGYTFKN